MKLANSTIHEILEVLTMCRLPLHNLWNSDRIPPVRGRTVTDDRSFLLLKIQDWNNLPNENGEGELKRIHLSI